MKDSSAHAIADAARRPRALTMTLWVTTGHPRQIIWPRKELAVKRCTTIALLSLVVDAPVNAAVAGRIGRRRRSIEIKELEAHSDEAA